MPEAVILAAARTPLGRRGGVLAGVHAVDLAAYAMSAALERSGLGPDAVDDVVLGCVSQVGEQSWNIARNAVLAAGWPDAIPGTTVDRQCGSSQQAVAFAAASVLAGHADVVVAGGVESMTRVPMGSSVGAGAGEPYGPAVRLRYAASVDPEAALPFNQGVAAELVAGRYGIGREAMDAFALASHEKAAAASDKGAFADEITPVTGVTADEGIRRDTDMTKLAGLKPAFAADGSVTAGSSSQISDGAAALVITTDEHARRLGVRPLARIAAACAVGSDPVLMLDGPIPATAKILRRTGLDLDEIDVFEVNEAFAAIPLAWLAETGADEERLNPRGGAIALGHPLGASGARLAATMLHYMRDTGSRRGLQVMCEGGGMANATVFELL
ncbi:thiolase family protein [Glycomyces sp. TRM65418]|uniref:thiolase family protein n=1 Tax=Glycomyces sp. TRM65418 TaxID=2867006 RepID=UPI001CE67395|nr:thiolase family protein [Glycomyces sp. TRM65418]MCC3764775.1 thiolase family protein [Glycomyces sp. TRM65418]QZD54429.1 thiolase family protein [Glycomyces sp. TRM65418]